MKCPICMTNELASGDESESCIDCLRTGRLMEFFLTNPVRSNLLSEIRKIKAISTANLWPTGPGVWEVGMVISNGRYGVAGTAVSDEEGRKGILRTIPIAGQAWRFGFEGEPISGELDDEELVSALTLALAPV